MNFKWNLKLSWRRIGPFLLTNAGCRHCRFQCISLISWAHFSDVMVSLGCRKMSRIKWAADHQTVTMTFFGCKFGFRKCFKACSQSNRWDSCQWLSYKIHFSSHVTIWSRNCSLLHTVREDNTTKWRFFGFCSSHEAPTYWAFSSFQFASNAELL